MHPPLPSPTPVGVASNRANHQPCSGHVASRGSTKQATLIVVRGCHVILTSRASPANRASEDLTLQVANARRARRLSDSGVRAGQPISVRGWRALVPWGEQPCSRAYNGAARRGGDSTVDRHFPGVSGCCLAPGCSGRVAWRSEPLTSKPYFDPTEQRDFGQIHMVQMVLFCPLFEGSGTGSAVRLRDYPMSDSRGGRGGTPVS